MTTSLIRTALVTAALTLLATACDDTQEPTQGETEPSAAAATAPEPGPIPELSVAEARALLEQGAVPVDANSAETRSEFGVVPNARLLTSSGRYDPAAELPGDRSAKLVFYCGSENCSASDGAAERARDAGYADVAIMRAGIRGWCDEGHETTDFPSS